MENPSKLSLNIEEKIRLRDNWLKIIVVIVSTGLISYKLIISDVIIDFTKFDFNSFLSLVLAVFSIGLSVAFFIKANDTSNRFYDNTYKFTKDMSTMLGQIESGFGERLKHLDEGYSGLRDRFDKMPFNKEKVEEKIKTDTEELEKALTERNQVIEELAKKAKLSQQQRDDLIKNLSEKEENLAAMKHELLNLQRRMEFEKRKLDEQSIDMLPDAFVNYLSRDVYDLLIKNSINPLKMSYLVFRRKFIEVSDEIHQGFISDGKKHSLFDDNGKPTEKCYAVLKEIFTQRRAF